MAERRQPDQRWEIDWADDGFASAEAQVPYTNFDVTYGAGLQSGEPHTASATGLLRLYSPDGRYHPDRSEILSRSALLAAHDCRLIQDGAVRWHGSAEPTDRLERDGWPYTDWRLRGRHWSQITARSGAADQILAVRADSADRVVLNGGTFKGLLARFTTETGVSVASGHDQQLGLVVWQGSMLKLLEAATRMTGGFCFEQADGSFRHRLLRDASASADVHLAVGYEPVNPVEASSEQGTVRNYGEFMSQRVVKDEDVRTIGAKDVAQTQQGSTRVVFNASGGYLISGIEWATPQLSPDPSSAHISSHEKLGPLSYAATVFSSIPYVGSVLFRGKRENLEVSDNAPVWGDADSIRRFGKRELDMPPWWPAGLTAASTTAGSYLRMASRALQRLSIRYTDRQSTAAKSKQIAAVAAGDVVRFDYWDSTEAFCSCQFLVVAVSVKGGPSGSMTTFTGYRPRVAYDSVAAGILDGRVTG